MKKFLTAILALVMAMSLAVGVTAFADESTAGENTMTINIVRQNEGVSEEAALANILASYEVSYNNGDTLYDAILGEFGDDSDWYPVDILDTTTWQPTGEKGQVLNSLTFTDNKGDQQTWTNESKTENGSDANSGKYTGQSWVYYFKDMTPMDEDGKYLNEVAADGSTLTLNYQYSSFTWGNWTEPGTQE